MNIEVLQEAVLRHRGFLKPPYDELVDIMGIETICRLSAEYGGTEFYVPMLRSLFRPCIREAIKEEYNGYNANELCRKYGVCRRAIFKITEDSRKYGD